ncbi:VOC family protein [Sphingobium sp. Sx8-8]|uniref:VOC family protein n=1 Tax=Sphingobium sp. Sx8-8 TaxID=2933617 RepID=UPI001F58F4A2|nr:VOC family protein [Sphingobium sp. Sx8-8]
MKGSAMSAPGPLKALGEIVQIAYLPSNFEAALDHWTKTMGVGPFFMLQNIQLGAMKYEGQPTDALFSIAIGYWGDIQIELIRPENDAPSVYTGPYAVKDQVHHVCLFVDSIDDARRACAEIGAKTLLEGKVGDTGEVIYIDAGGGPGHVIEMLQPMEGSDALFAMMREAARDWDGSDPLRVIG